MNEIIRSLMNNYTTVNKKWFKLKYKKSWLWELLHPKQAKAIHIWLEHCEKILQEELEKKFVDWMVTGTVVLGGPLLEDIERLEHIKLWNEIIKEKL